MSTSLTRSLDDFRSERAHTIPRVFIIHVHRHDGIFPTYAVTEKFGRVTEVRKMFVTLP